MNPKKSTPLTARERRLLGQFEAERAARAKAEAAARDWQDRFRVFLDHAPMPAFIRDAQGCHVYGNKPWAAQFDRPLNDLLGKTNWELFPQPTAILFEASDHAARERGEVSGLLESGLAPDGLRHWWKVFKFPLPQPDGEMWIGGLALDVTDLMQVKSRLHDFEADLADGRLVPDTPQGRAELFDQLPPRQRQVLELFAAGWSTKQVAARLGISPKTVDVHRAKLLRLLDVTSLVEAVRLKLSLESGPPKK
jgi:DNA-binding CsgD family transcriptional regulator